MAMESRNMATKLPDGKLTYWYNWGIYGPDGKLMISFAGKIPPLEKDRLSNIDYLRCYIIDYPEAILLHKEFWYTVVMLRQKALKDKEAAGLLREIGKLIVGDGRRRKNQEELEILNDLIVNDIDYFKNMLELTKDMTIEKAIIEFIRGDVPEDNIQEKKLAELSKYRDVYFAYKKLFIKLIGHLTEIEAFCFLEKAADSIDKTNVIIDVEPDGRLLTFEKKKTWYVKGSDMYIETV